MIQYDLLQNCEGKKIMVTYCYGVFFGIYIFPLEKIVKIIFNVKQCLYAKP